MSINRSIENIPSADVNREASQCSICRKDYEVDDVVVSTPCSHIFHKDCIVRVIQETQSCPICDSACRQTRLKCHNILENAQVNPRPNSDTKNISQGAIPRASIQKGRPPRSNLLDFSTHQTPTPNITNRENNNSGSWDAMLNVPQLHRRLDIQDISDSFLQNLINEAVRNQLASMNISHNMNQTNNPSNGLLYRNNYGNRNSVGDRNGENGSRNYLNLPNSRQNRNANQYPTLNWTPDKISSIISGWHIKFCGQDEGGLSVDNFIYRIHALTIQSLRGDFNTLCQHVHLLFCDKAIDWYWRFHATVARVDWETLCRELRNQFRDRRTDFDLREQMRARKQRHGEKFDSFYDAILQITDRLQTPVNEYDLIEILKRNLRPEVRKEILHFNIISISDLRDFVRKHEILEDELGKYRSNRTFIPHKVVSELGGESSSVEGMMEVNEVVEFKCWNCSKTGHKFEDCVGERRIFCYGCGTPNIFKPNCAKCNKSSKNCHINSPGTKFHSRGTQM